MSLDTVALIVMARVPEPSGVKTGLAPALSPDHAARLHRAFIQHVVARLVKLAPPELVMCFDPPEAGQRMFQIVGQHRVTRYIPQSPGDLAMRIDAVAREIGKWYGRLLFVGVDAPDVPAAHITRAADMLQKTEVVIGPNGSGGFWCLGLQHHVSPQLLLNGVEWSGKHVTEQTRERARTLDCSCEQADVWQSVDRPEDLQNLLARLAVSSDEDDRLLLASLSFLPQGVTS